jgi:membrane-associated phospholipid phosphatase
MSHNGAVQEKSEQRPEASSGYGAPRGAGNPPPVAPQAGRQPASLVPPSPGSADAQQPWFDSSARPLNPGSGAWLRWSEAVMAAYFLYAAVVSVVLPVPSAVTTFTVGLNLTLIGVFFSLAYLGRVRPSSIAISMVRDWFPLAVLMLAYREMGWFAPAQHTVDLENGWIVWDRLLLSDWGVQSAIETLGPALPALLELCYALVYAIGPFCMAAIYWWGYRSRADAFLFRFLLGTVLSYALFPFFPSEPPRTIFPADNVPAFDTIFRQFNWWLLGGHGIHTSVFPSAHVSSAYAAAFAIFRIAPERKATAWMLTLLATGIFWATIYGRYHYAVDAVAGLAVAIVAFLLCEWITKRQIEPSK